MSKLNSKDSGSIDASSSGCCFPCNSSPDIRFRWEDKGRPLRVVLELQVSPAEFYSSSQLPRAENNLAPFRSRKTAGAHPGESFGQPPGEECRMRSYPEFLARTLLKQIGTHLQSRGSFW